LCLALTRAGLPKETLNKDELVRTKDVVVEYLERVRLAVLILAHKAK
jgi:hypothetical protein